MFTKINRIHISCNEEIMKGYIEGFKNAEKNHQFAMCEFHRYITTESITMNHPGALDLGTITFSFRRNQYPEWLTLSTLKLIADNVDQEIEVCSDQYIIVGKVLSSNCEDSFTMYVIYYKEYDKREGKEKVASTKLWKLVKEVEEKNENNQSWLGEFRATMEVNFGENGRCVPGIFKDHQGYNPARYIVELFTVENLEKILQKLKSQ